MPPIAYPCDPLVRAAPPLPAPTTQAILAVRKNAGAQALHQALGQALQQDTLSPHPAGGLSLTPKGAALFEQAKARLVVLEGGVAWINGHQDPHLTAAEQGAFVVGIPQRTGWRIHPTVFQFAASKRTQPIRPLDPRPLLAQMDGLCVALARTPHMRPATIWPLWATPGDAHYRNDAVKTAWSVFGAQLWDGIVACAPNALHGQTCQMEATGKAHHTGIFSWAPWSVNIGGVLHNPATTSWMQALWGYIDQVLRCGHAVFGPVQALRHFGHTSHTAGRWLWKDRPLELSAHARMRALAQWHKTAHQPEDSIARLLSHIPPSLPK